MTRRPLKNHLCLNSAKKESTSRWLQFFDHSVRHKKSLISIDYSVHHMKSLISKRVQFFHYSLRHKKSLISKATASYFLITLCAIRNFCFQKGFNFLITLCAIRNLWFQLITLCTIRNLWFQKRLQFFDYSARHKKSLISKIREFLEKILVQFCGKCG